MSVCRQQTWDQLILNCVFCYVAFRMLRLLQLSQRILPEL